MDSPQPDWYAIRSDYEQGLSLRALASKYGLSKSVIGDRKYKEQWQQDSRANKRTQTNTQEVIQPDMNAAVRAALGFKLRYHEHKTWDEVAQAAGYASRGAARNAVRREAARHISHDIEEIREEELYRLEQLQKRCYQEATDKGNDSWTWSVDRWVNLSKRKSELMNLDKRPEEELTQQNYIKKIVLIPSPTGNQDNGTTN